MDIDHSGPRLRHLLLRILIVPTPPSTPTILCSASPAIFSRPASAQDHPSTWASPVSAPSYKKNVILPSLIRHYQILTLPLLPLPHHIFQVPIATAPSSAVVTQPPVATTSRTTSPLPRIPYPLHRPRILAIGLPTPLPLPAFC